MNIFNAVHNRLIEQGFQAVDFEEIEKLGFVVYMTNNKYVCLKEIQHKEVELENIVNYSNQIRNTFIEHLKNIHNTYLIICTEEQIDYETFYMIERDNIALRKYVIRNENDLNRIPFLDNLLDEEVTKSKILNKAKHDGKLDKLFNMLDKEDGQGVRLKENQIDEIVKSIVKELTETI